MAENQTENWEQFVVDKSVDTKDEWSQYSTTEKPKGLSLNQTLDSVLGAGAGVAAVGGAAIGLAKTGLPQKTVGAVKTIGSGFTNLPKVLDMKKGTNFAESIRASFVQAHSDKVATFGNQIDELSAKYPKSAVSFQSVADELNNNWKELTPEVKSVIKKTPYLRDMVGENPKTSITSLPLAKSQEVINYMNTKVPTKIRFNNLEVIDTINNIRGAQLDAFPEMEAVRTEYKEFIKPYNEVKSQFKFGKLLNAIKNKFGGAEGQMAVEKVLPKDVVKKIGGYRAAAKLSELPQAIPFVGKALKTVGGMFGYAPMAMQAFEIWSLRNDPESQYRVMMGREALTTPKGSFDREVETGRVL